MFTQVTPAYAMRPQEIWEAADADADGIGDTVECIKGDLLSFGVDGAANMAGDDGKKINSRKIYFPEPVDINLHHVQLRGDRPGDFTSYLNRYFGQWNWLRRHALGDIVERVRIRAGTKGPKTVKILVLGASTAEEMARVFYEVAGWLIDHNEKIGKSPKDMAGWHINIVGLEGNMDVVEEGRIRLLGKSEFVYLNDGEGALEYAKHVIDMLNQYADVAPSSTDLLNMNYTDLNVLKDFSDVDLVIANTTFYLALRESLERALSYIDSWQHAWLAMTGDAEFLVNNARFHKIISPEAGDGEDYLFGQPYNEPNEGVGEIVETISQQPTVAAMAGAVKSVISIEEASDDPVLFYPVVLDLARDCRKKPIFKERMADAEYVVEKLLEMIEKTPSDAKIEKNVSLEKVSIQHERIRRSGSFVYVISESKREMFARAIRIIAEIMDEREFKEKAMQRLAGFHDKNLERQIRFAGYDNKIDWGKVLPSRETVRNMFERGREQYLGDCADVSNDMENGQGILLSLANVVKVKEKCLQELYVL